MLPLSADQKNLIDISLVICAYNAEQRLPEVLEALTKQTFNSDINWEVVVVDNNSKDNTTKVAKSFLHRIPNLNIHFEKEQGLIYARKCGYLAAQGSIISYVDDDNIVSSNYVESMYFFFKSHPKAGVVGPKILPLMDYEPPSYFEYIKEALAIRDFGNDDLNTTNSREGHPPGAGMTIPKALLNDFFENSKFSLIGRKGDCLSSGEDTVIAINIKNKGYEWWYNSHAMILHRLPENRMNINYLSKLFNEFGSSLIPIKEAELGRKLKRRDNVSQIIYYLSRIIYSFIKQGINMDKNKKYYFFFLNKMYFSAVNMNIKSLKNNTTKISNS